MNQEALNRLTPGFFFQRFLHDIDPYKQTSTSWHCTGLMTARVTDPFFLNELRTKINARSKTPVGVLEVGFTFYDVPAETPFCENGGFVISVRVNNKYTMLGFSSHMDWYDHSLGNVKSEPSFAIMHYDLVTDNPNKLRSKLAEYIATHLVKYVFIDWVQS